MDLWTKLQVVENTLQISTKIDSYLAADLAEFLRQRLLSEQISFTYETVMSHSGKIEFLKTARDKGYKVYLYYIATEDPEISFSRIQVRVAQNGHAVPKEIAEKRYYKSLMNLKDAVKQTNRAYIFDNSQKDARFIAEITNGKEVTLNDSTKVEIPNWVIEYLLNGSEKTTTAESPTIHQRSNQWIDSLFLFGVWHNRKALNPNQQNTNSFRWNRLYLF